MGGMDKMRLARLRYDITIYANDTTHTVPLGTVVQVSESFELLSARLCTIPGYPSKYDLYAALLEFLDDTGETKT